MSECQTQHPELVSESPLKNHLKKLKRSFEEAQKLTLPKSASTSGCDSALAVAESSKEVQESSAMPTVDTKVANAGPEPICANWSRAECFLPQAVLRDLFRQHTNHKSHQGTEIFCGTAVEIAENLFKDGWLFRPLHELDRHEVRWIKIHFALWIVSDVC
jgi:hypothetical protein